MLGIYIAAIISTLLAGLIVGMVVFRKLPRNQFIFIGIAILLQLPMSYISFNFLRMPFDSWFHSLFSSGEQIYRFLTTFYAPIFEEPVKLWPLFIPWFYRNIKKENFVKIALALGLGFGVGEIWFLAQRLAVLDPKTSALPWYQLTGFINERVMVCLMHGAFTSVTLYTLTKSKSWLGIIGSMALHYLGNFPIYLMAINLFDIGKNIWLSIVSVWIMIYFIGAMFLLVWFSSGNFKLITFFFGKSKCPECKQIYDPPMFGVNLFTKRFERCPHCKHWHLVGKTDVAS